MDKEEQILYGAIEIFQRDGIKAHTMDEIAKMLKVSKKTLYIYFRNREMLITRVTKFFLEQEQGMYQGIIGNSENSMVALHGVISQLIKITDNLSGSIYQEITEVYPNVTKQAKEFSSKHARVLYSDLISKCQNEGFIDKNVNADLMARILIAPSTELVNPEVFPTETYNLYDVQVAYYFTIIKGIATEEGQRLLNSLLEEQMVQ